MYLNNAPALSRQIFTNAKPLKMKSYLLVLFLVAGMMGTQAQILKKIKDKVSGSEKKATDTQTDPAKKADWCKSDSIAGTYEKVYSSSGKITILYDESCLGLGTDSKGYMMVLAERVGNNTEYVIIADGKETGRYKEMKDAYLPCRRRGGTNTGNDFSKYITADSTKFSTPGSAPKTVNTQNIDVKRTQQGLEMAKQTEEYKKLSPEEKKQFDEMMKNMPAMANEYNKNVGNKTYDIPGSQAVSGSYVSGYRVVVNKKEYGKFSVEPQVLVSADEKNVFILGVDIKAGFVFQAGDKKYPLQQKGLTGGGSIIGSPAGNKAVYVEMKQKTEAEFAADMKNQDNTKYTFRVLKADGTVSELVTASYEINDLRLTNSGNLVNVNPKTGEIFTDGKMTGRFTIDNNDYGSLTGRNILVGDTPDKICYYGSDGSLKYPDGTKKDMGIIFPAVTHAAGKTWISWFRQCGSEIYIGKMSF